MPDNTPQPTNDVKDEPRPSWNPIGILVLYIICFALGAYSHRLAAALAAALLLATIWSTFSKKEYEALRKNYPNYPRGDYIGNSLIQHILFPWAIILIFAGIGYFIN